MWQEALTVSIQIEQGSPATVTTKSRLSTASVGVCQPLACHAIQSETLHRQSSNGKIKFTYIDKQTR